jgi:hypothetical protein
MTAIRINANSFQGVWWNRYHTTANVTNLFHHKTARTCKIVIPCIILTLLLVLFVIRLTYANVTLLFTMLDANGNRPTLPTPTSCRPSWKRDVYAWQRFAICKRIRKNESASGLIRSDSHMADPLLICIRASLYRASFNSVRSQIRLFDQSVIVHYSKTPPSPASIPFWARISPINQHVLYLQIPSSFTGVHRNIEFPKDQF